MHIGRTSKKTGKALAERNDATSQMAMNITGAGMAAGGGAVGSAYPSENAVCMLEDGFPWGRIRRLPKKG